MRVIIEVVDGRAYAYREDEVHFRAVEAGRNREGVRIKPSELDNECDLLDLSKTFGDFYIVMKLKDRK